MLKTSRGVGFDEEVSPSPSPENFGISPINATFWCILCAFEQNINL